MRLMNRQFSYWISIVPRTSWNINNLHDINNLSALLFHFLSFSFEWKDQLIFWARSTRPDRPTKLTCFYNISPAFYHSSFSKKKKKTKRLSHLINNKKKTCFWLKPDYSLWLAVVVLSPRCRCVVAYRHILRCGWRFCYLACVIISFHPHVRVRFVFFTWL